MKKKYYNLLAIPALAVILFCLLSGFSSQDPQAAAKSLIHQRIKILLAAQEEEIPYYEAEQQLRKIEADTILKTDLEALRGGICFGPDSFCSVKIKDITQQKQMFHYRTYRVDMLWDMGQTDLQETYNVVLKEENKEQKLTVFEPIKV